MREHGKAMSDEGRSPSEKKILAFVESNRAAAVAMPPEMQPRYAAKMAELMPAGASVLLVGLDYDPKEMQGPPFNLPQARVRTLFEPSFDVTLIEAKDGLAKSDHLSKRGVTWLEEASYVLRRKAGAAA